jgi:hypothetical protein
MCAFRLYRAWLRRLDGATVIRASNVIAGADRYVKPRTLKASERSGLLKVQWGQNRSPLVTALMTVEQ